MQSKLPQRPSLDERIQIAITSEQKRRAFDLAARQGVSVGHLIRSAIESVTTGETSSRQGAEGSR